MMGVDRSEDLARWVSQVDPNFDDDEEKRSQTDDLENVNNNNRWRGIGKRSSGIDGGEAVIVFLLQNLKFLFTSKGRKTEQVSIPHMTRPFSLRLPPT